MRELTDIVIIGAGYGGMYAARSLRRRLRGRARITVINRSEDFVERIRLHQYATGQHLREVSLASTLAGTGTRLVIGEVTAIDRAAQRIIVHTGESIAYDRLIIATGSFGTRPAGTHGVAAMTEAEVLRRRLEELDGGRVAVVGGGLTGIEMATELAEQRPDLRVQLITADRLAHDLSQMAQRHLRGTLRRLRIELTEETEVRAEDAGWQLRTPSDVRGLNADVIVWTTGFLASPLAAEAGLSTDDTGRVLVDDHLRSVTDPRIAAIGDAAAVLTVDQAPARMSCQTTVPMGVTVAADVAREIGGASRRRYRARFVWRNISLGRNDAITQFSRFDDRPLPVALVGRPAVLFKELISASVARTATTQALRSSKNENVASGLS
ncbi:FAD-dependent oxidoreductase [Nocardioides sp. NPDC006273]|uniref:NAD(P)/FAD-dependent oxidoreductase n=1 Tax=Nocardioides sp. NPDC006273 TaxID=3155598 RepID=UPI0033A36982